jgi:hypothetical protein
VQAWGLCQRGHEITAGIGPYLSARRPANLRRKKPVPHEGTGLTKPPRASMPVSKARTTHPIGRPIRRAATKYTWRYITYLPCWLYAGMPHREAASAGPDPSPPMPPKSSCQSPPGDTNARSSAGKDRGRSRDSSCTPVTGGWPHSPCFSHRRAAALARDWHRNAWKGRKTYRFSKDYRARDAVTAFTRYSYNLSCSGRGVKGRKKER